MSAILGGWLSWKVMLLAFTNSFVGGSLPCSELYLFKVLKKLNEVK